MNIDPDGHAWYNVLGWIGLGLVAAAATVLTCGAFGVAVGGAGLLGAVIHGAAVGALIGAGAGAALGAVGGMVYDAYQGNDFGTSIWEGVQAGFGIGAIAGAIIGGAAGYIGYQPTQITGFTKHGINNAISKNGHGVNERALLDTIKNPNKIVPQAFRSKFKFVGKDAVVVLNKTGKVITTWAKHRTGWRFGIGLWLGYELTQ